jgi:hypothetical protein
MLKKVMNNIFLVFHKAKIINTNREPFTLHLWTLLDGLRFHPMCLESPG